MINRVCLDCHRITPYGSRCPACQAVRDQLYKGAYRKESKAVREAAQVCWLCGEGYRLGDPWTADHVDAGNAESPLLPAHRSCNSRRGNKTVDPKGRS